MSPEFHCPTCGERHPSRVHAPSPEWLATFMAACGPILEPCPRTGRWVEVSLEQMVWSAEGGAAGPQPESGLPAPWIGSLAPAPPPPA